MRARADRQPCTSRVLRLDRQQSLRHRDWIACRLAGEQLRGEARGEDGHDARYLAAISSIVPFVRTVAWPIAKQVIEGYFTKIHPVGGVPATMGSSGSVAPAKAAP